jgi:hypothetical protein
VIEEESAPTTARASTTNAPTTRASATHAPATRASTTRQRCPYCRGSLPRAASTVDSGLRACACTVCGTVVHAACAGLHGRCVTFGCPGETFGQLQGAAPLAARRRLHPALPWPAQLRRALQRALNPDDELALVALSLAGVGWICVRLLYPV